MLFGQNGFQRTTGFDRKDSKNPKLRRFEILTEDREDSKEVQMNR